MNALSPSIILWIILGYFLFLIAISFLTSRNADNETFFLANRKSPWILVAIGMIGASLSGVTLISIPGVIGKSGLNENFSYMQTVFGYLVGYFIIATVLLPLYYRLNLTTIYGYLEERFGTFSYKTGAAFFLLSRILGASMRLYLVAIVLHSFVMEPLGISFIMTVAIAILLIWVYTFQGGIKTIVWTDTIQTICMLTAVILTIVAITNALDFGVTDVWTEINKADYGKMFYFGGGWSDPNNFFKQFIFGALLAVVMTGLDQDMMQKNLTCKSLKDAQKNVFTFSVILVFANILFLSLGALLYMYAGAKGIAIPEKTDLLFPELAFNHLGPVIGVAFVLGLIAAAYSSADSALTALTTSFCVDFLNFEKSDWSEDKKKKTRWLTHIGFSFILLLVISIVYYVNEDSIVNVLFKISSYTYGPILGLFAYGIISKSRIYDRWSVLVCLAAPILVAILDMNAESWFDGLKLGLLTLPLNGIFTVIGLMIISKKAKHVISL